MDFLRRILHYANPLNLFKKNEGEGILLCLIYLLIRTLSR